MLSRTPENAAVTPDGVTFEPCRQPPEASRDRSSKPTTLIPHHQTRFHYPAWHRLSNAVDVCAGQHGSISQYYYFRPPG